MRILKFIASSFLQVFLGFILFQYVSCECKFPVDFPDGKITYQSPSDANRTAAKDMYLLKFECSPGFQRIGSPYIMCIDEEWVPEMPFCTKLECSKPPEVENAVYEVKSSVSKFRIIRSMAVYTCNEGYELNDPEQFSLLCVLSRKFRRAVWRGELPTCNARTEMTPGRDSGQKGEKREHHLPTNQTVPIAPEERTSCSDPGVSEFGSRRGECCISGTSLQFNCNEGYEMVGETIILCLPSGNWTSSRPLCQPLEEHCELPPTIPHGTVIGVKKGDYYVPQEEAKVLCDLGYKYEGPEYILCEEGGEWDSEFGECKEIHCDMPPPIANGRILELNSSNMTSFPYNFNLTYVCNENHRLIGNSNRVCRRRGWSGKMPACERMNEFQEQSSPKGKEKELRKILYFVFDVSRGIGLQNFRKSIRFAKALVSKVGISEDGTRAGAMTFSSRAEHSFLPLHFTTTKEVLAALDEIEFTGGGTNINSAFTLLRRDAFPLVDEALGKKNLKYAIFLMTDGKVNMGGSPEYEAQILKRMGAEIYCIGITGNIRKHVLYSIASTSQNADGNDYTNVYILNHYSSMSWIVQEIINGTIDYSQCGLGLENSGNNNRERNIGSRISIEPWPWMAALFVEIGEEIPPKYELGCAGTIIHQNFILTAAHCLYEIGRSHSSLIRNKKSVIIKLGLTDLRNETYLQEFGVINMFLHPEYRPGHSYDYDIALLQIEKPAVYNAFVRPICLPSKELSDESPLYKPQSTAWTASWDIYERLRNGNEGKPTNNFKELSLPIQPNDRCIGSLRENGFNRSLFTDRMLCAGDGTDSDICEGISGAPLMQLQFDSEGGIFWTQVGLTSWGLNCGLSNTYGYYSHLQRFVPWIDDSIENALKAMNQ